MDKPDKKVSDVGDGLCLYKRPDGTVYIGPSEKQEPENELDDIFGQEPNAY